MIKKIFKWPATIHQNELDTYIHYLQKNCNNKYELYASGQPNINLFKLSKILSSFTS